MHYSPVSAARAGFKIINKCRELLRRDTFFLLDKDRQDLDKTINYLIV